MIRVQFHRIGPHRDHDEPLATTFVDGSMSTADEARSSMFALWMMLKAEWKQRVGGGRFYTDGTGCVTTRRGEPLAEFTWEIVEAMT